MRELILASASPRRRELLLNLGLKFGVFVPDVDETVVHGEPPDGMVLRLAGLKAKRASEKFKESVVLAADTTVAIKEGQSLRILGKPTAVAEAIAMLEMLSGSTHSVFTGYSIISVDDNLEFSGCVHTEVTFDVMTADEIREYVATGEPMDKAGAYGIQGYGARLVRSISGSYTNVVGLPLCEVCRDLERAGIRS